MKVVFIGDVIGKPGRRAVKQLMPQIKRTHAPDLIIANAENSAGGFGFNVKSIGEMQAAGVDFFTTGNHVWDKMEGMRLLSERENIIRPANFPASNPGVGVKVIDVDGVPVAIVNMQGRVFMPPLDCPFRTADRVLESLGDGVRVIIFDMHAEATSEKIAMGWYLDGRVSVVLGTHTHVPTSDERINPGGTAFVSDVGMTGSYDSILGVKKDAVIQKFLNMRPTRFEVAKRDVRCDYVVADIDAASGKTQHFEHIQLKMEE